MQTRGRAQLTFFRSWRHRRQLRSTLLYLVEMMCPRELRFNYHHYRHSLLYNAVTAINQIWDWDWTDKGISINNCSVVSICLPAALQLNPLNQSRLLTRSSAIRPS